MVFHLYVAECLLCNISQSYLLGIYRYPANKLLCKQNISPANHFISFRMFTVLLAAGFNLK